MFIGHYGVGFGLKRFDKSLSLGLLFLSAQLPDILWNGLVLLGLEQVKIVKGITKVSPLELTYYPFSHSLLSSLIMAALIYLCARFIFANRLQNSPRLALAMALALLSHFALDFISHMPDLPIYFGESPKIGLGLWNNVWASYLIESLIFIVGYVLYIRVALDTKRWKKIAISIFAVILFLLNLLNLSGATPPNTTVLAAIGLLYSILFVGLGFWFDSGSEEIKVQTFARA